MTRIEYRPLRNNDPPRVVALWNDAASHRGAAMLHHASALETWLFSKPYFDPAGLILAWEGPEAVGFAHAGFGPAEDRQSLSHRVGVVCAIAVRSSHRGRGIGSELFRRSEEYLAAR